jgi:3-methyladenine DNA glycosylase AlkD
MTILIAEIRRELRALGDPERARAQQAYMKSAMPYYGVTAPEQRETWRRVFDPGALLPFEAWCDAALAMWRGAKRREERYAAIALTGRKRYRAYQTLDALPMYEEFIVDGAWWDTVDDVATHRVGPLLAAFPGPMKKTLRAWAKGDDMWKRRSAIIAQVSFEKDTDTKLLEACIAPSIARKEFWLRKAIGWALRAYAWHEPQWVIRYVGAHEDELSGLSKREALKNVGR